MLKSKHFGGHQWGNGLGLGAGARGRDVAGMGCTDPRLLLLEPQICSRPIFCLQEALAACPAHGSRGAVPGISGGTISVPALESDAHMEAFNKHLLIGCKL